MCQTNALVSTIGPAAVHATPTIEARFTDLRVSNLGVLSFVTAVFGS
jgi:hypothetical protein